MLRSSEELSSLSAQIARFDEAYRSRWFRKNSRYHALVRCGVVLGLPPHEDAMQFRHLGVGQHAVAEGVHVVVLRHDLFDLDQFHRVGSSATACPYQEMRWDEWSELSDAEPTSRGHSSVK